MRFLHLGQLVDVITSSCPLNGVSQSASKSGGSGTIGSQICVKPEILLSICDLLCFCILHHPYRIKCHFLLSNLIDKVLLLTQRREKYLVLAAVRFVRILISRNDEHVSNHIVKKNLLNPIVDAFIANGNRYNLLQSSILELFEHMRKDNLKILLKYLVVSFWDKLVKFEILPSIHSLKLAYNQSLENPVMNPVMKNSLQMLDSRKRKDERALVQEGEGYLNEERVSIDSGEEDTASVSTPKTISLYSQSALSNRSAANSSSLSAQSRGLVDDKDDKEYKLPLRKQPETSNEGEEATESSFGLKRKLARKVESEHAKKQRVIKNPKGKNRVFAALCSTFRHAVLPSKRTCTVAPIVRRSSDTNKTYKEGSQEQKPSLNCHGTPKEKEKEKETGAAPLSCIDSLQDSTENRQQGPFMQPKSSPKII